MRPLIVAGNWKMNGDLTFAQSLIASLKDSLANADNRQCLLFPPAVYLAEIVRLAEGSELGVGAQNVLDVESGAYTGEISTKMLKDVGATHALVGHSERRTLFHEDDEFIFRKLKAVVAQGLVPILCVGETLEEYEAGTTEEVIYSQLRFVLDEPKLLDKAIIAYEPVWAIGTGKTATPEIAQNVHAFIRSSVAKVDGELAERLPILYGGSVKASNAAALFNEADVDGGLVGGASLKVDEFVEIVSCTK